MTDLKRRILIAAALAACGLHGAVAPAASAAEIPAYAPLPPAPAADARLPTIVILSMGGTIASRGTPRLNVTSYGGKGVPRVDPQHWLDDEPELATLARIRLEDGRPPQDRASGETQGDDLRVAARLRVLLRDPEIDGVVVTHGTNTLAESAYLMNLIVDSPKPIVFVGSQRPWTALSGDGPRNLYDAVRVAASKDAAGKGVLHCMNQLINTARDVSKTSAYRVQTFKGIDVGAIGYADPDQVKFYREPLRRHTVQSEFSLRDYEALPPVEIAYAYRDAPGYLIDAMVAAGVKGIVVDGTGAGSPTTSQSEAIRRAQAKGVVVVATARTHGGRVQDTPRRREAQIVPGDNLMPEKARILLQLALTRTADLGEIQRIFDEY